MRRNSDLGDPPGDGQDRPMTKFSENLPAGIAAAPPFVTALARASQARAGQHDTGTARRSR
jgi:hypothetical protein